MVLRCSEANCFGTSWFFGKTLRFGDTGRADNPHAVQSVDHVTAKLIAIAGVDERYLRDSDVVGANGSRM